MWLFNGAQVYASDHVTFGGNAGQSELTINGATLLDTGEYVCSANNSLGQATTKTFLRIRSKFYQHIFSSLTVKYAIIRMVKLTQYSPTEVGKLSFSLCGRVTV